MEELLGHTQALIFRRRLDIHAPRAVTKHDGRRNATAPVLCHPCRADYVPAKHTKPAVCMLALRPCIEVRISGETVLVICIHETRPPRRHRSVLNILMHALPGHQRRTAYD